MNVEEIYRQVTDGNSSGAVRAGWVERYLESAITFWCNLHAPPEARDPMNDQMQHIFDIGNNHQGRVNDWLYPGGVQSVFTTEEEGFRQTLDFMSAGGAFISGIGSMDLYTKYVGSGGTPKTSKDKIITYNDDDCFATIYIYDWIMAQQR